MCVYVGIPMPWHMHGGQRTTQRIRFLLLMCGFPGFQKVIIDSKYHYLLKQQTVPRT